LQNILDSRFRERDDLLEFFRKQLVIFDAPRWLLLQLGYRSRITGRGQNAYSQWRWFSESTL